MRLIDDMKWRYATKKFDEKRSVPDDHIDKMAEAIRLAPTSYGLQLFKVLIISDQNLKRRLRAACWDQASIEQSSHLFVFANMTGDLAQNVNDAVGQKAKALGKTAEELSGYSKFIKRKLQERTEVENNEWTAKQTYLALANLMAACAELRVDSCPIEGFVVEEVNRILGLEEADLNAAVLCAVGYRSSEDHTQHVLKFRKERSQLFELIG